MNFFDTVRVADVQLALFEDQAEVRKQIMSNDQPYAASKSQYNESPPIEHINQCLLLFVQKCYIHGVWF